MKMHVQIGEYTRIGKIEDLTEWKTALGNGDV